MSVKLCFSDDCVVLFFRHSPPPGANDEKSQPLRDVTQGIASLSPGLGSCGPSDRAGWRLHSRIRDGQLQ